MTKTDAPELRKYVIYYVQDDVGGLRYLTRDPQENTILETWYRADLALAAQGALLKTLAHAVEDEARNPSERYSSDEANHIAQMIHDFSPDATAALAEIRREAVEQERERCARIVESLPPAQFQPGYAHTIAAAIRENDHD